MSNILTIYKENSAKEGEGAVEFSRAILMLFFFCALKLWDISVRYLWFGSWNCRVRGILIDQADFYQPVVPFFMLPKSH